MRGRASSGSTAVAGAEVGEVTANLGLVLTGGTKIEVEVGSGRGSRNTPD